MSLETVKVREFHYNPESQLTTITTNEAQFTQTYDTAGNLTRTSNGTVYTYDLANQPTTETAPNGNTIHTKYWATGQRQSVIASHPTPTNNPIDAETRFYWDNDVLVNDTHQLEEANPSVASYLIGVSRHARTTPRHGDTETSWYFTDRHNNTVALTNNNNEVAENYEYSDYGATTPKTPADPAAHIGDATRNPFQFSGEYTNPSGTQHLSARTYDPHLMRFTTKDTAPLHNLYGYANSNPIMMVDPTGNTASWDTIMNGVMIGVGIMLAAFSIGTAVFTAGASLTLAGLGITADLFTIGVGTSLLVDELAINFIDNDTSNKLMWAETALSIGLGAAIGFGVGILQKIRIDGLVHNALFDDTLRATYVLPDVDNDLINDAFSVMNKINNQHEPEMRLPMRQIEKIANKGAVAKRTLLKAAEEHSSTSSQRNILTTITDLERNRASLEQRIIMVRQDGHYVLNNTQGDKFYTMVNEYSTLNQNIYQNLQLFRKTVKDQIIDEPNDFWTNFFKVF
jgi:RHS repeat-associated protein